MPCATQIGPGWASLGGLIKDCHDFVHGCPNMTWSNATSEDSDGDDVLSPAQLRSLLLRFDLAPAREVFEAVVAGAYSQVPAPDSRVQAPGTDSIFAWASTATV